MGVPVAIKSGTRSSATRGIWGGVSLSNVLMSLLLLLVAFMVLYPLAMLIYGSFWSSSPGSPGYFTLEGYSEAYANPDTYDVIWTTVWLAIVRTLLAVSMAIGLAWVVARTNVPYKRLLEFALLFTFFMPLVPRIMAWILLLSPRSGFVNVFLRETLPFSVPSLSAFSYWGIIWVGTLTWVPILYVFIAPAFKSMDANLEESARISGASMRTTVLRINLPLLAPAIVSTAVLGFVKMMESFTVEAFLGTRAEIYVFSTRIYEYVVHSEPPRYGPGMALAVAMLVLTLALVAFQWRLLGRRQYTTVTGRGFQARPIDLGPWRWVALGLVLSFVVVSTLLPLAVLIWSSFMKVAGVFMDDMYTLDHYRRAFADPKLWMVIQNTIVMAAVTATIGMVICAFVAYVVHKTKFFAGKTLDLITWIPWAVPSVVLALGFLWAYITLPLPVAVYGTLLLLILVMITKGYPLGTRTMSSTVVQISNELEQAARVHGASWLQTFARVVLPLLFRGFLAGWILLFASTAKDLDTVILLYTSQSSVISTQVFSWWNSGYVEVAMILGLLEAVLIAVCFIAAQVIGSRAGGREAV